MEHERKRKKGFENKQHQFRNTMKTSKTNNTRVHRIIDRYHKRLLNKRTMPLESCMILLDNSQFMRNGDYTPSRLAAQIDAANLLVSHKTQSNPESTVGIIAMNGGCFTAGVELLVSPTDDVGKILGALHGVPVRGSGELKSGVDIPASVQVASLALKHRRNKNGQQRIVIFVGSPLTEVDKKTMVKAGKTLKKNNVKIDIVAMGELEENEEKLMDLVNAANGNNTEEKTCHLVTIPAGTLPSDILISSPVVHGGDANMGGMGMGAGGAPSAGGAGGGDDFAEYGGIDPNLDPELAMALRISMEEERNRQERITRENQESSADANADASDGADSGETGENAAAETATDANTDVKMEEAPSAAAAEVNADMGDEDAMLQQALAMSMADAQPKEEETAAPVEADMEEDDDATMQMALAMSMADGDAPSGGSQQFQDPQFVNQLLGSLPGVDPNDPSIKDALEQLNKSNAGDKKDADDKKE
jgi:26S proteasome regulatory subunit N10